MQLPHLFSDVDVKSFVEMLLQVGYHGVVPRYTVDSSVLQTYGFHNFTAHLHNERNELWADVRLLSATEQVLTKVRVI